MAVTAFSKGFKMTALSDSLNQATVGHVTHPVNGRYVCRVSSIQLVTGAAGGVTVLHADGVSGPEIFRGTTTANDTVQITFSQPQDIADLSIDAASLGTNTVVIVHLA